MTIKINQHWQAILWIGGIFFVSLIYIIKKFKLINNYFIGLTIALICCLMLIFLTIYVRPGSYQNSYLGNLRAVEDLKHRYTFIAMPIILIFWTYLLNKIMLNKKYNNLVIALFLIHFWILSPNRLFYNRFLESPKYPWNHYTESLISTIKSGKPKTTSIPIAPNNWVIQINKEQ